MYLGQNLTWKYHINTLKSKISRSLFALNRVKHILPPDILKSLYFSLVQSHLMYGIQSWRSSIHINKLESTQKRAIRIINNKVYNSHTDPLFRHNNILKIRDLYQFQSALFVHDYKQNTLPRSFRNYFITHNQNKTNLKHSDYIFLQRPSTKFSSLLPVHQVPSIWNSLSNDMLSIQNRNAFKSRLKKSFIKSYCVQI